MRRIPLFFYAHHPVSEVDRKRELFAGVGPNGSLPKRGRRNVYGDL